MDKKTKKNISVLVVLAIIYFIYKMTKKPVDSGYIDLPPTTSEIHYTNELTRQTGNTGNTGQCITPKFKNIDLSGRTCAGTTINENKTLRLGDESCEVLLLQQRLNAMQSESYILKPNGKFCCQTKFKLNSLMRTPEISLNRFSPDEQIGFNELEGGNKITPYSYMELQNLKNK